MKPTDIYGSTDDETIYATLPLTADENLVLLGEHTAVEDRRRDAGMRSDDAVRRATTTTIAVGRGKERGDGSLLNAKRYSRW